MREIAFDPHPWLRSGHAQTIASAFARRRFNLPRSENRLFQVDAWSKLLAHCHWQLGKPREAPVMVIVHGLEGSSDSNYVKGIAEKVYKRGYHVVRMNQRNCGGTEGLTPTLYNSGMSGDYRLVLEELIEKDGFQQIFFAGYSMGGNLVTKMAGELGDQPPDQLKGVCAVCPSYDLSASADALERRENYFYERHFVKGLMSRYARKAKMFPERYRSDSLRPVRTVREFDDVITAPHFGYRDAEEYYEAAGAKRVIDRVRVPLLVMTSEDDPFVPYASFLALQLERLSLVRFNPQQHGGHCGFISRYAGSERFWAEQRIAEFCDAHRRV